MALVFERVLTEGLGDLSYLIGDDATGRAAVIDPRADVDVYLVLARQHRVSISHILQTHIHEDFLSGAVELSQQAPGSAILASHEGGAGSYGYAHKALHDGDRFDFGSVVLTARHTPGHTPEHVSFVVGETTRDPEPYAVFSGGSLLINAAGRTDLLGREAAEELVRLQYRTLYQFFLGLPDHVIVHPTHAHGSPCGASIGDRLSSTIGYERRFNPFLQHANEADFRAFALGDLPAKPVYYPRLKETNTKGPEVLGALPRVPALPATAFSKAVTQRRGILVDTRAMLAFGGGHIEGALNIAGLPELSIWAGWMLRADEPILLVLERDDDLERVLRLFLRTGFVKFAGYLVGGMKAWDNAGLPLASTPQLTVHDLKDRREQIDIVDVRSDEEWRKGHIPGAKHLFLPDLERSLGRIDKTRPTAVYCDSGYRASLAASLLQRRGFSDVSNVPGSWQAWTKAGYPVETG